MECQLGLTASCSLGWIPNVEISEYDAGAPRTHLELLPHALHVFTLLNLDGILQEGHRSGRLKPLQCAATLQNQESSKNPGTTVLQNVHEYCKIARC